jgi:orotate phosphoribosyltransferase
MTFGERREIFALVTRLEERAAEHQLAVLDLTCVQSLGEPSRFGPLNALAERRPTVVVVRHTVAARHKDLLENAPFSTVMTEVDKQATILEVRHPKEAEKQRELLLQQGFRTGASYRALYMKAREDWLTRLAAANLREPESKRYHFLGDGTRANYWLDVKRIIGKTELGLEIAYHIARELSADFLEPTDGTTLVVGNDTAAVLATHLRLVLGSKVSVAVFDRLGPFPYLAKPRIASFPPLGTKAVIIEDVVSTGREVDLIALLALVNGSEITRVLTVYDLEVAEPLLVPRHAVCALAKPSRALNYIRLPLVSPSDD